MLVREVLLTAVPRLRDRHWSREGKDDTISGFKVMFINEHAGSGGEALARMFLKLKPGPLIGTRTWGGLIGIDRIFVRGDVTTSQVGGGVLTLFPSAARGTSSLESR